jgi:hypothetical protein
MDDGLSTAENCNRDRFACPRRIADDLPVRGDLLQNGLLIQVSRDASGLVDLIDGRDLAISRSALAPG